MAAKVDSPVSRFKRGRSKTDPTGGGRGWPQARGAASFKNQAPEALRLPALSFEARPSSRERLGLLACFILALQPVQKIGGALRMGGGGEDRPLVSLQNL